MEDNRMPTLFEILNRFSKPPLDLWSFYVFLKEQYGGVEYLEFWLDCAAHTATCKELAKAVLLVKRETKDDDQSTSLPRIMTSQANNNNQDPTSFRSSSNEGHSSSDYANYTRRDAALTGHESPNSSVLFNILQEDVLDTSPDPSRRQRDSNLTEEHNNQEDVLEKLPSIDPKNKRFSTLSAERARKKRDTVSRLSEILDNMQMPEYPDATATSPTRNPRSTDENVRRHQRQPSDLYEEPGWDPTKRYTDNPAGSPRRSNDIGRTVDAGLDLRRNPPRTPPPTAPLNLPTTVNAPLASTSDPDASRESKDGSTYSHHLVTQTRRAVRDSALKIIYTYLVPKSLKAIELPSDGTGWSMAEDIRQASTFPGGLENPKLFEPASIFVFDALEREALPAFLVYRALSNVQPVSATMRLIVGLIGLFGAFWLSFVFLLLDWQPRADRCWIILPFALGWYLVITSLYHIDPLLALTNVGERDGGGFARVQENFVKNMLFRRGAFAIAATILLTAAFSVLFIFVPGHRL